MLFPWDANETGGAAHANNEDVTIKMNDATETVIEYMVFFE